MFWYIHSSWFFLWFLKQKIEICYICLHFREKYKLWDDCGISSYISRAIARLNPDKIKDPEVQRFAFYYYIYDFTTIAIYLLHIFVTIFVYNKITFHTPCHQIHILQWYIKKCLFVCLFVCAWRNCIAECVMILTRRVLFFVQNLTIHCGVDSYVERYGGKFHGENYNKFTYLLINTAFWWFWICLLGFL